MTSKSLEALEELVSIYNGIQYGIQYDIQDIIELFDTIKQDLERLEKENKELKETIEIRKQMNINLIDFGTKLKQENEKFKKKLDIYQKYTGVYYDEETKKYYIAIDCDFGCKGDVITKEEFEVLGE